MIDFPAINFEKKGYIFELDDVLFPKQDYLLQVYYLFANIIEYTDQNVAANELSDFLKDTYIKEGEQDLFAKMLEKYPISKRHEDAFKAMHVNAKLPLKLLLYKQILALLTYLVGEEKSVFILTKGNPLMQMNKIKQIEWNDLDQFIKVYFYDEIILKSVLTPLDYLLNENNLFAKDTVFVSTELVSKQKDDQVTRINITEILK